MGEKEVGELDSTFPVLLIVVTIILLPTINPYLFQVQSGEFAGFSAGYLIPLLALVLLWWVAVFFNKTSIRVISWYGLFYYVVLSFWLLYLFAASPNVWGIWGDLFYGAFVCSPFFLSAIPTYLVFKRYSSFTVLSRKMVWLGCCTFALLAFLLAVMSTKF